MSIYESLDAFYDERGGRTSGESDFGVHWRSADRFWPHRLSVVHETGDVYAAGRQSVRLFGTLPHLGQRTCERRDVRGSPPDHDPCPYEIAEQVLRGWEDHMAEPDSLSWVEGKL